MSKERSNELRTEQSNEQRTEQSNELRTEQSNELRTEQSNELRTEDPPLEPHQEAINNESRKNLERISFSSAFFISG